MGIRGVTGTRWQSIPSAPITQSTFFRDPDFEKPNAITIAIEKPIRINHDPVFTFQANPD